MEEKWHALWVALRYGFINWKKKSFLIVVKEFLLNFLTINTVILDQVVSPSKANIFLHVLTSDNIDWTLKSKFEISKTRCFQ